MFSSNVLKIENFRRLWLGQAISQFGDSLYALLFLFMVDQITNSPAMVGYVGALEALPFILLAPYAGVIADRIDRRKVMLFSDLASAGILLTFTVLLVFNPKPPVALIFSVALLLSLVNVFFMPAKSAAIPALVPADRLMEANALSSATQSMMPMLGLALSGSVLGLLYKLYPNAFFPTAALLNGLSFLWSAYHVARLPRLLPQREADYIEKHPVQEALDGFRLVRSNHVLWMVLLLNLLMHLFISPFMVAFVAVNRQWFGGQFGTLASFEASFLAVMVVTSLAIGKRKFVRPGMTYIIGSAVIGLFVAAMAYSQTYWAFFTWNALCGIALPFISIPLTTYVQRSVPDAYMGRVNSAMMMVSRAVTPLSMGLAGIFLEKMGLVNMFLVMGLGMCAAALIGLFDPKFRDARMPEDAPTPTRTAEKEEPASVLVTVG